jgi:hypothetical protein
MSTQVANLVVTSSTLYGVMLKINELARILSTQTVTANTNANGAVTVGNTFLVGIFAGSTGAFGSLRGGNVQTANTLLITSNVAIGNSYLSVGAVTTSNISPNQVIDSFPSTGYRTTKFVLQVTSLVGYLATEILLTHNGSNIFMTEYASLPTNGALGTFSANIASNTVNLLFTPTNAVNTVEFERRSLAV